MKIVFFRVGNSQNLTLRSFEDLFEHECIEMLSTLRPDEYHIYDMAVRQGGDMLSAAQFVEDFNDSIIDDTWWCMLLPDL